MEINPATLATAEFWDERYRSAPAIWTGNPNPHLVTDVAALTPSTALDMGAGEGADAIWLAGQGWQVTAVDISAVAVERGRGAAEARGDDVAERISWVAADVTTWAPPTGAFGLVVSHFLHVPSALRGPVFQRCIEAVAVGGTLMIVGHHISDTETTIRRPQLPDLYFEAQDVAAMLPNGWTIVEASTRPRTTNDHDGAPVTINDAVLIAHRDQ